MLQTSLAGLSLATLSYGLGAVGFLLLGGLLLTSWRGRLLGGYLVLAVVLTFLWAVVLAYQGSGGGLPTAALLSVELIRDVGWFLFLFKLLSISFGSDAQRATVLRQISWGVYGGCVTLVALVWISPALRAHEVLVSSGVVVGMLLASITGIALVEQIYRNTRVEQRWGIKFLCLGIGGLFTYDFFLYADTLLFRRTDIDIWTARGAVAALTVPLITVSAGRNPQWSVDVFVSRGVVLHTATLLGAGLYLVTMAVSGYYIRYYGGNWGGVLQLVFLAAAGLVFLILLFSGHLRARLKVFLSKHFFSYKYDYREEWIRLIHTLGGEADVAPLYERVIRAIAELVECPGGALWMRRESGVYTLVQRWGIVEFPSEDVPVTHPLVSFMEREEWVVRMREVDEEPELYGDLKLPQWLLELPRAWLVIPLMHDKTLRGFMVLVRPRARLNLNWEDIDLLKLAGREAAAYLAQYEAAQALAEARQFEAFNRLSAFVIHDLKNLIAQLSLVVSNAERHRDNPRFFDDAMGTIRHSVDKMNRLMKHLRQAQPGGSAEPVELAPVLHDVVQVKSQGMPIPTLSVEVEGLWVAAERDRLTAVLGHLVQNAQDATPPDGSIHLRLSRNASQALVDVTDNGVGMDGQFIREHLFRPFDTTKGLTGMGIGAFESREFIRSVGGTVEVDSTPGEGTRFRVTFPLVETQDRVAMRESMA